MKEIYLISKNNQSYLGKVSVANKLTTRMKGLLGTSSLPDLQGLLIKPCKQVHTIGMSYPISVWFISKENQIIRIVDNLKPFRFSPYVRDSHYVLEFPKDWAQKNGCNENDYISGIES